MAGIDAYTVLMLHADGLDASTTFTDSEITPKTVTAFGNAQIDTAQSVFGGASALFDGAGDYLSSADHADWDFGTADYTIDFRLRSTSFSDWVGRADADMRFGLFGDGNIHLYLGGSSIFAKAWAPAPNTWYHVALTRSGTNLDVWIDGTKLGSTIVDSTNMTYASALYIGADEGSAGFLTGWMDEIRISKGIARWTANFTPPTDAYSVDVPPAALTFTQAIIL